MTGFNELIPQELVNVFDERELELLIGGIGEVDVDDWARHTDYRSYTQTDQVISWFWQCVRSWPAEKKSRLLQFTVSIPFVSGSSSSYLCRPVLPRFPLVDSKTCKVVTALVASLSKRLAIQIICPKVCFLFDL